MAVSVFEALTDPSLPKLLEFCTSPCNEISIYQMSMCDNGILLLDTKIVARSTDIELNCAYYVPSTKPGTSSPSDIFTNFENSYIRKLFQRGDSEWLSMKLTGCGGVYSIFNV